MVPVTYLDQADQNGGNTLAELVAKIDVHIGSVDKLAEKITQRRPPAQPVFGRVTTTGLFVAGAVTILRFPLRGPDQGHFWYVRSLIVGGLAPTTTAAGRCDVFVSGADLRELQTLAAIGMGDWRDQSTFLPNIAFYGRGELELRSHEKLFVAISDGTDGQAYVASMSFEDYEEGAVRQGWSL